MGTGSPDPTHMWLAVGQPIWAPHGAAHMGPMWVSECGHGQPRCNPHVARCGEAHDGPLLRVKNCACVICPLFEMYRLHFFIARHIFYTTSILCILAYNVIINYIMIL